MGDEGTEWWFFRKTKIRASVFNRRIRRLADKYPDVPDFQAGKPVQVFRKLTDTTHKMIMTGPANPMSNPVGR
jgi:hypothetical protein